MFYRRYTPPHPLSALVDCFWYSEGFEGTHQQERLLPNGESSIVIDLREAPIHIYGDDGGDESFEPAIFCGARTDCFIIDTCAQERVIGVQFRPGGAYPFLGMPASEVANATHSLENLWPGQAADLRDALLHAGNVATMFAILERILLRRLLDTARLHPAVAFAIRRLARPGDGVRVRDVADEAGLSSRRLSDLFEQQTGLAPKAFQRVRRFQRALRSLHTGHPEQRAQWANLAAFCGYYDQAHFIHDFRRFSGMTPSDYITVATPHLNHVPLS